jgi:hypothetical protein
MSNTKLAEDIRKLADSLHTVADAMSGNTLGEEPTPEPTPQTPTPPEPTVDQVRAVLADKSSDGKTEAVKALLNKYGAGKLSAVKPGDFAALMEEAMNL